MRPFLAGFRADQDVPARQRLVAEDVQQLLQLGTMMAKGLPQEFLHQIQTVRVDAVQGAISPLTGLLTGFRPRAIVPGAHDENHQRSNSL